MKPRFTEIMNLKIRAGSRTLYVDLKENTDGSRFLSISEVPRDQTAARSRIVIDEEFVLDLHRALGAVVEFLGSKEKTKAYTVKEKRRGHPRAYDPWTSEEETQLKEGYAQGQTVDQLAKQHRRAPTAVLSRLYQMGVLTPNEKPRWR